MILYMFLIDDPVKLFVENEKHTECLRYDKKKRKWVPGELELWENRVGFDDSEPEDSIYRYGCMRKEIIPTNKEKAEEFINKPIDELELERLLELLENRYKDIES